MRRVQEGAWLGHDIPQLRDRGFLTQEFSLGSIQEPPIGNKEFLESFLDYGIWLRVLSIGDIIECLTQNNLAELQRLSKVSTYFQLAGAAYEDVIANLIAWSVWSQDKDQSLLNILSRLQPRFSGIKENDNNYVQKVRAKFLEPEKKVSVSYRLYFEEMLKSVQKNNMPAQFGIPWKPHASKKGFLSDQAYKVWAQLPDLIPGIIEPLIIDKRNMLTNSYNKIKHGPQVIIASPMSSLLRRGFNQSDVLNSSSLEKKSIRVMLKGNRTQQTPHELEAQSRVSPFLIDDAHNLRGVFNALLGHTMNIFMIGTFLFNATYPKAKRSADLSFSIQGDLIKKFIGTK